MKAMGTGAPSLKKKWQAPREANSTQDHSTAMLRTSPLVLLH